MIKETSVADVNKIFVDISIWNKSFIFVTAWNEEIFIMYLSALVDTDICKRFVIIVQNDMVNKTRYLSTKMTTTV